MKSRRKLVTNWDSVFDDIFGYTQDIDHVPSIDESPQFYKGDVEPARLYKPDVHTVLGYKSDIESALDSSSGVASDDVTVYHDDLPFTAGNDKSASFHDSLSSSHQSSFDSCYHGNGWGTPSPKPRKSCSTPNKDRARTCCAKSLGFFDTSYGSLHSECSNDVSISRLSPVKNLPSSPPPYGLDIEQSELLFLLNRHKKQRSRFCPFDYLPDDIVVKIFSKLTTDTLSQCFQVCRRWYRIAWHSSLWKHIVMNNNRILVNKALSTLTKLLSYETPSVCVMVESINLDGCDRLTDGGLHVIATRCPELRYLSIQGCVQVTNDAVFEVVSSCVNLEHLNVSGCPLVTCVRLTDTAIAQSSSHHHREVFIRYLDLTDCLYLDNENLHVLAIHCTKLQNLYLRRCGRITDVGVEYITKFCINLRELSLSDCHQITDFAMRHLSNLNLRYLSIAKCRNVSDVGVKFIVKHCKKLRYLNVRGCEAVSDDGVEYLSNHCRRMKSLDIGKCDVTDEGLEVLGISCPHLRKLSLKGCDSITDKGVTLLAYNCRGLQQLNIQDCHLTVNAYRMIKKYCKRCIIEHTNPGFFL